MDRHGSSKPVYTGSSPVADTSRERRKLMADSIKTYDEDGNWDYSISVRPLKRGKICIGIDCGVEGMFATLASKDIDELIRQLKKAKKLSMAS